MRPRQERRIDPTERVLLLYLNMKIASRGSRNKSHEESDGPIPLWRPDDSKGDDKEAQTTYKLRSVPAQANSPTYEVTVKYFDTGLPEEWLLLLRKFDEICVGQNLTTGVQHFTLMRTLLRGDALAAFITRSAAAGGQMLANLSAVINGVTQHIFPERSLQKQKRYMRRFMRKPYEMRMRVYSARVTEINAYLNYFPPFLANQQLPNDEILELLEFAIPTSWQREMTRQGYDPAAHSVQDLVQFCERLESTEKKGRKPAGAPEGGKPNKKRVLLDEDEDLSSGDSGEGRYSKKPKFNCLFHGRNFSHGTHDCAIVQEKMGKGRGPKPNHKNRSWHRSRGDENGREKKAAGERRKFSREELNTLVQESVKQVLKDRGTESEDKKDDSSKSLAESLKDFKFNPSSASESSGSESD